MAVALCGAMERPAISAKNGGRTAATTLVENAEFATSYRHQARVARPASAGERRASEGLLMQEA
jgi:hypothetical protein